MRLGVEKSTKSGARHHRHVEAGPRRNINLKIVLQAAARAEKVVGRRTASVALHTAKSSEMRRERAAQTTDRRDAWEQELGCETDQFLLLPMWKFDPRISCLGSESARI
jgi:hypothetical protein